MLQTWPRSMRSEYRHRLTPCVFIARAHVCLAMHSHRLWKLLLILLMLFPMLYVV
nr:MAG TPA: hypothetical protein [Caudoviricetes sp.]